MEIIIVPSPQPPVTPIIPQKVGLGVMVATAGRALTPLLFPPARTNAISVAHPPLHGLGVIMAPAIRALTTCLVPPARTNAISV